MNPGLASSLLELAMFGPEGRPVVAAAAAEHDLDAALAEVDAAVAHLHPSNPKRRAVVSAVDGFLAARARAARSDEQIRAEFGAQIMRAQRDDEQFHAEVARLTAGVTT